MTSKQTNESPTTLTEKAAWLKERYWRFGLEEELEDQLFDLFEIDEDGQMTAQPRIDPLTGESRGLMVLGRSGDGKTALLQRTFRESEVLTVWSENLQGNTLFITVPPEATIKKLAELILAKTGYQNVHAKLRSADAWEMVMHRISMLGIKVIVIDECHHIFRRGSGRDVAGAIQSLKHIMQSAGGAALIIAGVPSLRDAVLSEPSGETARRFQEFRMGDIRSASREAILFARNFQVSAKTLGIQIRAEDNFPERVLFARHGQIGRSIELGKALLHDAVTRRRDGLSLKRADEIFRRGNRAVEMTPFDPAEWPTVKKELLAIGWVQ